MKHDTPPWTHMREDIERMGGAWPPPGAREVERAVAVRPPVQDYERKVRLLLERRKVLAAIIDKDTPHRANWREEWQRIERELDAYRTT